MDVIQMDAQLLSEKLGLQLDSGSIENALSSLLGDGKGGRAGRSKTGSAVYWCTMSVCSTVGMRCLAAVCIASVQGGSWPDKT